MRVFYSDPFVLPLPQGHRFPMEKYVLLRERIEAWWPTGVPGLTVADGARDEELEQVHDPAYVGKIVSGTLPAKDMRRIGFPWSPELVERSRRSVGGTIAAARSALEDGFAVSLSGGTHHAFPDRGEGFCVFNDVAVAIEVLRKEGIIRTAVVLDLDVHQGNGTGFIFQDDPDVFTLSVHGGNNYPFRKVPSDLDIDLPDATGDEAFLNAVEAGTHRALQARNFDLAFFLAGADPFAGDRLGRLSVSKNGLSVRDKIVLSACRESGVPLTVVMSGGYAREIEDTVDIHSNTVRMALEFAKLPPEAP